MKNALRMIALSSALSLAAITTPSMMGITMVGAQDQDHHDNPQEQSHQGYSNNRYYKVGNKEGYQDYQRKTQRKVHNHNYRNDDDRKAHDYGYQEGLQGQRYNSDHDHNDQH
jgi:hypothetical protein